MRENIEYSRGWQQRRNGKSPESFHNKLGGDGLIKNGLAPLLEIPLAESNMTEEKKELFDNIIECCCVGAAGGAGSISNFTPENCKGIISAGPIPGANKEVNDIEYAKTGSLNE